MNHSGCPIPDMYKLFLIITYSFLVIIETLFYGLIFLLMKEEPIKRGVAPSDHLSTKDFSVEKKKIQILSYTFFFFCVCVIRFLRLHHH